MYKSKIATTNRGRAGKITDHLLRQIQVGGTNREMEKHGKGRVIMKVINNVFRKGNKYNMIIKKFLYRH